jgi:hypothetical protein
LLELNNELPNKTLELLNHYYYLELLENKDIGKKLCWILVSKAVSIILIHFSPTDVVYIQNCLLEHSFAAYSPQNLAFLLHIIIIRWIHSKIVKRASNVLLSALKKTVKQNESLISKLMSELVSQPKNECSVTFEFV